MKKNLFVKLGMWGAAAICAFVYMGFFAGQAAFCSQENLDELKSKMEPLIEEYKEKVSKEAIAQCVDHMAPVLDAWTLEFMQFLEAHYENKSSNSSLNNIAILKFREYRNAVNELVTSLSPKSFSGSEAQSLFEEFDAYRVCDGLGAAYIDLTKEMMVSHIRNTTYQKKSTMIYEKYQAINEQLRGLLFDVSKMYGYFGTLKNKLPGFLSDCVTI